MKTFLFIMLLGVISPIKLSITQEKELPYSLLWDIFYNKDLSIIVKESNDTVQQRNNIILLNPNKEYKETYKNGELKIQFENKNQIDQLGMGYYIYPSKTIKNITPSAKFISEWYTAKTPDGNSAEFFFLKNDIRIIGDTIYTRVKHGECGGTTPEGSSYKFEGNNIASIKAQTKAIFYVTQGIDVNGRDDWVEKLYTLESPWLETNTSKLGYTLPIMEDVYIDEATYKEIKSKAIATQKRIIYKDKDSLIKENPYYAEPINNLISRSKPNLEEAITFNDMYLCFGLDYFITKITVSYKDGTKKDFNHIAYYEEVVP